LFNCLPKYIREIKICGPDEFKENIDKYLSQVPDETKIKGLMPLNFQQSNSLLHQVARNEEGKVSWEPQQQKKKCTSIALIYKVQPDRNTRNSLTQFGNICVN